MMNRRLCVIVLLLLSAITLVACGDEETATPTVAPAVLPTTAPVVAATDTAAPLPTSTPLPPATQPPPTEMPTATVTATVQAAASGQDAAAGQDQQDPSVAATTAAAAGQATDLMTPWQSVIGVAVLNQTICATLQGLAQAGQQGGLGALAVAPGLLGVGGVLQSAQQQLGALLGMSGMGPLLAGLQADQASLNGVLTQWSGGQMDAAAAGAALQVICGSTNTNLAQSQQGAQDAGLSQDQVNSLVDQSKRDADNSLGGLRP